MKFTVGFSKPRTLKIGSLMIRAFERAPFSHAYVRWHEPTLGEDLVYQASHGMAHFLSGVRFDADALTVKSYEFELTLDQKRAVSKKAIQLAGAKYGVFQLFGMAFERVTGIRSPFRDGSRSYVCSELVHELLNQFKVLPIDFDPELSGPAELEKAVATVYNLQRLP